MYTDFIDRGVMSSGLKATSHSKVLLPFDGAAPKDDAQELIIAREKDGQVKPEFPFMKGIRHLIA